MNKIFLAIFLTGLMVLVGCSSKQNSTAPPPTIVEIAKDSGGYAPQYCTNTCASNYNQKPYPDCSCYAAPSNPNQPAPQPVNSCTDSDGKDTYTVGTTTHVVNSVSNIYHDSCVDNWNVKEYYCDGIVLNSVTAVCNQGCQDGKCLKIIGTCSDTDGGDNIYVRGTVSGLTNDNPQKSYSETDECCVDGTCMLEHSCVADSYGGNTYTELVKICNKGCMNGYCKGP